MVGIFSRFSAGAHRRSKSVAEVVETLAPNMSTGESDPAAVPAESPHGIEVGVEFKPVEHPVEPLNLDEPVKCPLPEPSILHDGRIWKEKMSSVSTRVRTDLPVVKEGSQLDPDSSSARSRSAVPRRAILPSVSAPEHNILALLDECDVSGSRGSAE
ncbi:hypothetical protein BDA96_04G290000 [Sorghum bicolor]|uniref:Cystic fibrosis transmembrane conductance regulator n=2 Tax=Sorghum bicolor TaxID=4558 RepID=A0A921R6X6_SORBI|nr:uncharacterized protein LOC8073177 [Sorghum bicolor]EES05677.1 hypothetical protein SORBI_3004G272300 [Sorghum bicolor]KAG0534557.1 hypothetical protein BDA96_04G290000 [Sorghum bicolor]|eukprot:XP_002452701.1 uncharacterized protein LOC8073177 [Sorghum bicolor]